MLTRRAILRSLATGALVIGARPALRFVPRSAHAATRGRPRFYLQVIPAGGMDAVWGADPKTRRDVDRGVDVPYAPKKIVEATGMRLAPAFAPLAKWTSRLAIVNAFRQNSANHPAGLVHTTCAMNSATPGMPTLLDLLGARRGSEAAPSISLGAVFGTANSPKYLGQPGTVNFGGNAGLFDHLDNADPEELATLAKVLGKQVQSAGKVSPSESNTIDNIRTSAAFLERWAKSPKFAPTEWPFKWEDYYKNGVDLQRVLWMFEHGLTRCATVYICDQEFDSHMWNFWQPVLIEYLANVLGKLFEELDARKVDGRPLSDQTVVFVGSEIGRFPRLNMGRGKDHLPQAPYLFFGPWFRGGAAYGATGRDMVAKPVSMQTGRPEKTGRNLVLDDIGRTLLELDGEKPEVFGYTGERLSFLLS